MCISCCNNNSKSTSAIKFYGVKQSMHELARLYRSLREESNWHELKFAKVNDSEAK